MIVHYAIYDNTHSNQSHMEKIVKKRPVKLNALRPVRLCVECTAPMASSTTTGPITYGHYRIP